MRHDYHLYIEAQASALARVDFADYFARAAMAPLAPP